MVCLSPTQIPACAGARSARAELLLTGPSAMQADSLAALALKALDLDMSSLHAARARGAQTLVLRHKAGFLGLAIRQTPLGAAHFHRAIAPFTPATQKGEMMRVIEHHEAHVSVKLSRTRPGPAPLPMQLLQAISAIAPKVQAAGLLWRPTGQLHAGRPLRAILAGRKPDRLLVAPKLTSIGPRHLPAISLTGAQDLLGHEVHLHLLNIDFETGRSAGYAFLRAALADPGLRARQSFSHAGQSYRISHHGATRDITLIPVEHSRKLRHAA